MNLADEIRFDGWTLRRPVGELLKAGARIRLQTQPLRVLEELLSHPGELVTREHLIAQLWPNGVVDFDTALNSAVRRLRTALDDHAETPCYIETIPRRGYRFIGRLDVPAATPAEAVVAPPASTIPGSSRRRWSAALAALMLVGAAIASFLALRTGHEMPGFASTQTAASPAAQEVYLRALHFFQRRAAGDLGHARRYYEEALAIDPDFAKAWVGLASVYWIETVEGRMLPEQGLSKVRDAAEQALRLNPRLVEAHLRLANYRRIIGDRREADEHMRVARALEPANPLVLAFSASMAASDGRIEEAVELQRRALEGEPLSQANRYNLGDFLYFAGRNEEAIREMVELSELNPTPQQVPEVHGMALVAAGRFEEALVIARGWPVGADRSFVSALAYEGLGRRAESDAELNALIESAGAADAFRIAEVYAHRGDADRAFEWLRTGDAHARETRWWNWGRRPLWTLPDSPFLQPLKSDPRWDAWYAGAREPLRAGSQGRGAT
jgi:DNA-binding winged helix-turn-helix (wHTH) protein/Tfp pilus assembly protein PilF